jgi:hypothetical protein
MRRAGLRPSPRGRKTMPKPSSGCAASIRGSCACRARPSRSRALPASRSSAVPCCSHSGRPRRTMPRNASTPTASRWPTGSPPRPPTTRRFPGSDPRCPEISESRSSMHRIAVRWRHCHRLVPRHRRLQPRVGMLAQNCASASNRNARPRVAAASFWAASRRSRAMLVPEWLAYLCRDRHPKVSPRIRPLVIDLGGAVEE